ncbi:TA system toxin CbtA family protein [Enterobacter hormaechei]|uniref:TA system toxin CbtA family protein n=1 Tax=Enterobacter hormaechei TaxID=158836 RepID=UPI000AC43375
MIQKHIDADTTPCDAMNFTVGKYDLARTDCHGFNVKEQSQYIGSIDILRAPEGY